MTRIAKVVSALWALLAGFLWLMTEIASGFSIPGWIPASGLFAAGVCLTMLVLL